MQSIRRWAITVIGLGVIVGCCYIGGYRYITAEWPWQSPVTVVELVQQVAVATSTSSGERTTSTELSAPPAAPPNGASKQHGSLHDATVVSQILSDTLHYLVYLPPGYTDGVNAAQRYPVVYLLHGAPGSYTDWNTSGNASAIADALIAAGRIPPIILVMPDGKANLTVDSEWANGTPPAPQAETYLIQEIVPLIDANYRTIADGTHRAIGGLSSGAYGAINTALHYPNLFSTAIGISGVYHAPTTIFGQLLFHDPATARYNSPALYVHDIADPTAIHVYLAVGLQDQLDNTLSETRTMEQALNAAHVPHLVQYAAGGHSATFWSTHLIDGLLYFAAQLAH